LGSISFLLVLSVLVFIHELGHYSVAKFYGVTVYDFSIGFGKKLFTKRFFNTNWSLSLIPLGGYVRMKGQEDLNPSMQNMDDDSYNRLSPFQRIMILLAGPGANFLLAFVLYILVYLMPHQTLGATIGKVIPNSSAYNVGLKKGDTITQINDTKIVSWQDMSNIIASSNSSMKFYVLRDGVKKYFLINTKLTDTKNMFKENIKKRMIGIAPNGTIVTVSYNLIDSIIHAYNSTIQSSKMIFQGVQKLISGVVPHSEVGGVISIGKVISDASNSGIVSLFLISALISVNLGVLNLLPIPALDGGHIMFNLYEMITKRKPNQKVLIQLTIMGWVILFALMALGLYNDINRFLKG
jgi:regulator of sigma E protease